MIIEEWFSSYFSVKGFAVFLVVLYSIAIVLSIRAIMYSRSSQGALAWSISLISFPSIAIPFYMLLGRRKFHGYVKARRKGNLEIHDIGHKAYEKLTNFNSVSEQSLGQYDVFEKFATLNFSTKNSVTLNIDGKEIYESIFNLIASAKEYLLVQFYIIRDDSLGETFKNALSVKAQEGVDVYLLYDAIGSHQLDPHYISDLLHAGVKAVPFISSQGKKSRFQLNFRNHRKMVVADGEVGILGGANIGDEYLGKDQSIGPWRDTNIVVKGPAVLGLQIPFIDDWYWSCDRLPKVSWTPKAIKDSNQNVLILPSGPADDLETCGLFFQHVIYTAEERIWIASPYFVPDNAILQSLILASMRGVDVRILIPKKSDNIIVDHAVSSIIDECIGANIKVFQYLPGFMHQKVILVDQDFASVGTANFDNRSMRLNFELTALVVDGEFNQKVEEMFNHDFLRSEEILESPFETGSFYYKFKVKLSRLFAPIL